MIGSCLGNNRKSGPKEKDDKKSKSKSSLNLFLAKTQKTMERVSTYFENFFEPDSSSEISEVEENRKSNLSTLASGTENKKNKSKFQSTNLMISPNESQNGSHKSTDSLLENHTVFSEEQWLQILKINDFEYTPHLELLASLREGIPEKLRPRIWFFLSRVNELKKKHEDKIYERLKSAKSNSDIDIKKDVPRTFPDTAFFQKESNQQKLFNILRAYANFDSIIGYTQGMNYVVGTLLLVLSPEKYDSLEYSFGNKHFSGEEYEEKVFWMFVFITESKNWREVYMDKMSKTHELLFFFRKKMINEIPDIYEHIKKSGFDLQTCFAQSFITILLYYTPLDVSKRIIDIFLLKGENIICDILIRVMNLSSKEILSLKEPEDLFNYLTKIMIGKCFENLKAKEFAKFLFPLRAVETINPVNF